MKKPIVLALTAIAFAAILSCSVADDVKDTIDAVECANQIDNLNDKIDDNASCSQIKADINKILSGSCLEFITAEQRTQFEFIRDNCTDE